MAELQALIKDYIADFRCKRNLPYVVKPSIPIVWFGDMERYSRSKKKVVTVGLNPSLKEFEGDRFEQVNLDAPDAIDRLTETLNNYFRPNSKPYKEWFKDFENVLSALDASYYKSDNVALHIDIYSAIATNPTWKKLKPAEREELRRGVDGRGDTLTLFKRLLNVLKPNVILFSVNQKVFNEVFAPTFELVCPPTKRIKGGRGFIRIYRNREDQTQTLISGLNMNGTPFGGKGGSLAMRDTIQELLGKIH